MVKAMLNSPTADANGYCNLFGNADFKSISAMGNNRARASEANAWMLDAEAFLKAYGHRIEEATSKKLLNSLQVRMVMVVHSKSAPTRANFTKLVDVAREFHRECKNADLRIPEWNKLPAAAPSKTQSTSLKVGLRETGSTISDALLAEKGFVLGQVITNKDGDQYTIVSLDADQKTITCKLVEAGCAGKRKKTAATITLDRVDLLSGTSWKCAGTVKSVIMKDIHDPLDNFDLKASIIVGMVKHAMAVEFQKSTEDACWLQTEPDVRVFASKKMKPGACKIVALTNSVLCVPEDKDVGGSSKLLGHIPGLCKLYYRSCNAYTVKHANDQIFVSKFFAVRETFDQDVINCTNQTKGVELTVMGQKMTIDIPMIVNTRPILEEEEVIVLKTSVTSEAARPPPSKKQKRK